MVQAQYSLLARGIELELTDVCAGEGVGVFAWSPLKGGWLSGKVRRDPAEAAASLAGSRIEWAEATSSKLQSSPGLSTFKDDERVWALLSYMQEVAAAHGPAVTVAQVQHCCVGFCAA